MERREAPSQTQFQMLSRKSAHKKSLLVSTSLCPKILENLAAFIHSHCSCFNLNLDNSCNFLNFLSNLFVLGFYFVFSHASKQVCTQDNKNGSNAIALPRIRKVDREHVSLSLWNQSFLKKCPNGHTLCFPCKSRVNNRCPTCRNELGNIRCLALEKIAASLELPCKYQKYGCRRMFPYYCKLKHELKCSFRPYKCPYAGHECTVSGSVPFLVAHLRDKHKVDMHCGSVFSHQYVKSNPNVVENAIWKLTVLNCFGEHFCLHFEEFQLGLAPVYIAFLRFMGDDNEAKNFNYSLEIGANGRKMIWQGVPRSIADSHTKVRDSHDGLIIQRNMALFFSGGDKNELNLKVSGRIWEEK